MNFRENMLQVLCGGSPQWVPSYVLLGEHVMREFKAKAGPEANAMLRSSMGYYYWLALELDEADREMVDYSQWLDRYPEGTYILDSRGCAYYPGSLEDMPPMPVLDRCTSLEDVMRYPYFDYMERRQQKLQEYIPRWRRQVEEHKTAGYWTRAGLGSMAIFDTFWYMRGFEQGLMDICQDNDIAGYLLDRIEKTVVDNYRLAATLGVDMISSFDDVAWQQGMMISPDLWRKHIAPRYERVLAAAKEIKKDVFFFYHTEGNHQDILDDLISLGFHVINPVQPECMDVAEVKRKYGDRITLWGCLGQQGALSRGTPEEVREEVRQTMEGCKRGGRFVVGPGNVIMAGIPVENVKALLEAIDRYSTYGDLCLA